MKEKIKTICLILIMLVALIVMCILFPPELGRHPSQSPAEAWEEQMK